ncbi:MAG: winged helix-turn-helix transcriptional regulator [Nocardioidaceae bacterium]|nr:MAG: winged helix-turn-helix transcriptional regulator [Nocardioidaceae bacterium]
MVALDDTTAEVLASTFQVLSTPSRLRILAALQGGPKSVGEIADEVGMQQSAVSHQLRLLRQGGFVVAHRHGRSIHYHLHDDHLVALLVQASHHVEHVRLGDTAPVGSRH